MDPIANMLTQIRNASQLTKADILVPHSKVKEQIAVVLKQQGYIEGFTSEQHEQTGRKVLRITLRYTDGSPAIRSVRRISKPGLRIYAKASAIPRPRGGFGHMILSTPQGFMTGADARRNAVGGEVICEVLS
ncbi:MAG: 30S ribosomal protein S8 [Patescibacteria group bacterium]